MFCTGHKDGRECTDKKGWKVPRKIKINRFVGNGMQGGEMMLHYSSPYDSNPLCSMIVDAVKAAVSSIGAASAVFTAVLLPTSAICSPPSDPISLLPANDLWNNPKWDTILEEVRSYFNSTEEL
ncbi:hypothetical protein DFS34DRAFT_646343 [Phlyctochytrium arcticum]|nr:hypothetical protein DFS34DRAFT_646343 [Phlyctochytrium arcticum]